MVNERLPTRIKTERLAHDCLQVPKGPPAGVAPLESLDPDMRAMIGKAQGLLEERPIWTLRALSNQFRSRQWEYGRKIARQYLGYQFRSGPWRDALIKFGVDPRLDPRYRIYQTMYFQFEVERFGKGSRKQPQGAFDVMNQSRTNDTAARPSHKFDASSVSLDGKVWQVCDITEPRILEIFASARLRHQCHVGHTRRPNAWS